jgi:hypothetical protein
MKSRVLAALALVALASRSEAQTTARVFGGEVSRTGARADAARLATRIPGVEGEQRTRIQVSGDSAQRLAMNDFGWNGRVSSVEFDEEDARLFWDVKIVPDTSQKTIIRYRVDAATGGILGIKEFTGIRGLARRSERKP